MSSFNDLNFTKDEKEITFLGVTLYQRKDIKDFLIPFEQDIKFNTSRIGVCSLSLYTQKTLNQTGNEWVSILNEIVYTTLIQLSICNFIQIQFVENELTTLFDLLNHRKQYYYLKVKENAPTIYDPFSNMVYEIIKKHEKINSKGLPLLNLCYLLIEDIIGAKKIIDAGRMAIELIITKYYKLDKHIGISKIPKYAFQQKKYSIQTSQTFSSKLKMSYLEIEQGIKKAKQNNYPLINFRYTLLPMVSSAIASKHFYEND